MFSRASSKVSSVRVPAVTTLTTSRRTRALLPPRFPSPKVTGPIIVLDHHHAHDDLGDIVVRDTSASATGEVVLELVKRLGFDGIYCDWVLGFEEPKLLRRAGEPYAEYRKSTPLVRPAIVFRTIGRMARSGWRRCLPAVDRAANRVVQVGTPEAIVMHPADDYVADFVAGISRLKVVKADEVMQPVAAFESRTAVRAVRAVELMDCGHDVRP